MVKLSRNYDDNGNLYYTAFDGKYVIKRVKESLGSGYFYNVKNTETGKLVRGMTDRLSDVRKRLASLEDVE